jgi:hypothetical protein
LYLYAGFRPNLVGELHARHHYLGAIEAYRMANVGKDADHNRALPPFFIAAASANFL